jgi:hypothetical protein
MGYKHINYFDISPINHSQIGVICTNLAIDWGHHMDDLLINLPKDPCNWMIHAKCKMNLSQSMSMENDPWIPWKWKIQEHGKQIWEYLRWIETKYLFVWLVEHGNKSETINVFDGQCWRTFVATCCLEGYYTWYLSWTVNAYMHVQVCDRCWTFIFHVRTILGMGSNHWLQFVVQSVYNPMINLELEMVYG